MALRIESALAIVLLFISSWSHGQTEEPETPPVNVSATIVDAYSKEPVSARVKFESLPYGSRIGVMSGDSIMFSMEGTNDYAIVVEAEGYNTYLETLKRSSSADGKIVKVVELVPRGGNRVIRLDRLIFALGKADITEASHEELDNLAAMLKGNREMTIQLEGHTDFRGNAQQNMKLSQRRVDAVKSYLIKKGLSKKRIKTKAFGGTNPLSRSNDNESRTKNRRVEVRILTN